MHTRVVKRTQQGPTPPVGFIRKIYTCFIFYMRTCSAGRAYVEGLFAMTTRWSLFGGKAKRLVDALDKSLAIIEFEPAGNIISANDMFCRLVGYDPAEIAGQHHSMFVEPAFAASKEYRDFWLKLSQGEPEHRE